MRSTHTVTATWVQDADLGAEVEVKIAFSFLPGAPEEGPSYASGGQPAEPAEVDLVRARYVLPHEPHPITGIEQQRLDQWAQDWLQGEGYAAVLAVVDADDELAREWNADMRADR